MKVYRVKLICGNGWAVVYGVAENKTEAAEKAQAEYDKKWPGLELKVEEVGEIGELTFWPGALIYRREHERS